METATPSHRTLYLDLSSLTTHSPSNSNRDDAGMPKHQIFGGRVRGMRSSQSIKAARRRYVEERLADDERSVRTKHATYLISDAIQERVPDISSDEALAYAAGVMKYVGIVKVRKAADFNKLFVFDEDESHHMFDTSALQFLPKKMIDSLAAFACHLREREDVNVTLGPKVVGPKKTEILFADIPRTLPKDLKIEQDSCTAIQGVTPVLFGAMNAQNPAFNVDATCQVAPDLGVTPFSIETDYYSALDDISMDNHAGSAMIGSQAFASMTAYGYTTLNISRLYEALENKELTLRVIRAYVESVFFAAPTGKQNTFANRNLPSFVYGRLHYDQPMSLAGAFEKIILPDDEHSVTSLASEQLVKYVKNMDKAYDFQPVLQRAVIANPDAEAIEALCPDGTVSIGTFLDDIVATVESLLD